MEDFFLVYRGAVDGLSPSQDRTLQAPTRACSGPTFEEPPSEHSRPLSSV